MSKPAFRNLLRVGVVVAAAGATLATASPVSAAQNSAALMQLLDSRRYLELEQALESPAGLTPAERAFFEGVLAARKNRIDASRRQLSRILAQPSLLSPAQRKIGLLVLADDDARSFHYAEAADTYSAILKMPALDEKTNADATDGLNSIAAARDFPAQAVKIARAFTVVTSRNLLGLREAPVEANGATTPWVLDSGAGLTTLSAGFAKRLNLKLSAETVPINGFAGTLARAHLAYIPLLRFGKAEVRNSPAIVLDDAALYIPELKFQINAILGAPVLTALDRLTFHADGRIDCAGSGAPDAGVEMFQDELLTIAIGTPGGRRLFILDTGGNNTVLLSPYWQENHTALGNPALAPVPVSGVGGKTMMPAAILAEVKLDIAGVAVPLRNVTLYSQPRWNSGEYFFGTISQDVLAQFESYTIDYRDMRFSVTPR
ncbi:MAG: retropepsin-like domain-containing protein [Alphaproteobacteria bacterium]|nr:retropepsin-like domain-containing protein [Alphaproteobacteria bacterium]